MEQVRQRTFDLVSQLPEEVLTTQHDPLMSPLIWDLGHIANFEELWFLQHYLGQEPISEEYNFIYNALSKPRSERSSLSLPDLETTKQYMQTVRNRVTASITRDDLHSGNPLMENGFLFELVLRHEMQHQETMLITLQIMENNAFHPPCDTKFITPAGTDDTAMQFIPGGDFLMGWNKNGFAYDNEKPAHTVEIEPFYMDKYPVNIRRYLEFMNDGGYSDPEYWSDEGWEWRTNNKINAPKYWKNVEGHWQLRRFDEWLPVNPEEPVMHVSWYEAEAFCHYEGKRLPTEAEWEYASSVDPKSGEKHIYPWGNSYEEKHANINLEAFHPAAIGAIEGGSSPTGCEQMIGDVWEWTASDFRAYPGFEAFPYKEYSEIFFGDEYKVLRGGAWSVNRRVISNTFRNWDYPIRRQIFSGFRCAKDAN
ncbi:MAG: ergothioneine biosynthesis protein EgtB [Candidatus Marinimicrobia bacterium]|nr:ergothioneine biosynthesis protein EgtB [Candidatus Neomarinimicrobiota bacterium]MCF7827600.1 ergothioneine biosynthesis protein EgtB [Candidatus Neomarinimicrobiota bacterium]MCF7881539.1 ergothioneine biosynthesis protein EgtB [Candidatus Neomarinimicrobiota bacterium]